MSKRRTSKVVRHPRNRLPADKTNWARLDAMTDGEAIAAARSDPDAPPLTRQQLAKMRRVPRVRLVRQRLGMTQAEFAGSRLAPGHRARSQSHAEIACEQSSVVAPLWSPWEPGWRRGKTTATD